MNRVVMKIEILYIIKCKIIIEIVNIFYFKKLYLNNNNNIINLLILKNKILITN